MKTYELHPRQPDSAASEVATGKARLLPSNDFDVTGLAFLPDGHTLAIIGRRQVKL